MFNNEKEIFADLNDQLREKNLKLTIICVGGYVLDRYGIRATQDVDSFYTSNAEIDSIIARVGEKHKINKADEAWLNNSVMNMNKKPPLEVCEVIYEFSNLKVMAAAIEYVACMKLFSAREQDIQDVAKVLKKLDIQDPSMFEKILVKYGFGDTDESLVLEAFGIAYGMKWLEDYYIKNESEIILKSEIGLAEYIKTKY